MRNFRLSSGLVPRIVIFAFDCLRLSFLLTLLAAFTGDPAGPVGLFQGAPGGQFPYMVYAAPNALFPLISFFLLIRFETSQLFIPLYATGKIIAVAALAGWIFFTLRAGAFQPFMRWSFFLTAADFSSAAGTLLLKMPILIKEIPQTVQQNNGGE